MLFVKILVLPKPGSVSLVTTTAIAEPVSLEMGFGTGGYRANDNTCGNEASVLGPDNGEKHIKAMGYISVQ